jgi:hypothetical protein
LTLGLRDVAQNGREPLWLPKYALFFSDIMPSMGQMVLIWQNIVTISLDRST